MSLKGMEADVLGALSDVLRGKTPDEGLLHICAGYLHKDKWRDDAEAVLLRTNAAESLNQSTAEALYGGIRCSATRIENYYKCPYRHFLDHGIKAQTPRDYVHDRIDIGTFMHLALDMFVRDLIDEQVDIKTLSEEATAARMRQTISRAAKEHDSAKLLEDERFAMQTSILTRELIDTAFRICASEQTFSFDVPTAFGNVVITGKIDRIDIADGYFRVVDYKSSTVKFALNDFAMGLSLQLPVYIEAARRLLADRSLKPAGGYYMRIGEQYHESADAGDKAARMSGISLWDADVLSAFSAVLPGGSFAAVDQALTSSGSVNARGAARLFTQDELDALLDMSGDLIKDAAEQIYSGATDICPANADVCQYCNYASVCQFNAEYDGNRLREPKAFDRECLEKEESR
jgi:ATP-dependent helicase/DNAse subunit B